ncbi:hypothetical protein EDD21DRAFT_233384 [Dissophora ornata]|nr:hypothetical protein EDD21DRAFT_233384 [Dissophora ornata]
MCRFIKSPPFGTAKPSENGFLHIWAEVFAIITEKVSIHTGEKALEASKTLRQMQSMEFGEASEAGRKVDCIFKYLDIEMSNIEFKCADISERDLAIQNRKNIRLARCIQESHVAIGVHDPCVLMADVFGFVGIFYQVMPMDEISIAGKTTSTIVHIPRTEGGLLSFLKGASLAIIWNYMVLI